jgi:hypothetical protein
LRAIYSPSKLIPVIKSRGKMKAGWNCQFINILSDILRKASQSAERWLDGKRTIAQSVIGADID